MRRVAVALGVPAPAPWEPALPLGLGRTPAPASLEPTRALVSAPWGPHRRLDSVSPWRRRRCGPWVGRNRVGEEKFTDGYFGLSVNNLTSLEKKLTGIPSRGDGMVIL